MKCRLFALFILTALGLTLPAVWAAETAQRSVAEATADKGHAEPAENPIGKVTFLGKTQPQVGAGGGAGRALLADHRWRRNRLYGKYEPDHDRFIA